MNIGGFKISNNQKQITIQGFATLEINEPLWVTNHERHHAFASMVKTKDSKSKSIGDSTPS